MNLAFKLKFCWQIGLLTLMFLLAACAGNDVAPAVNETVEVDIANLADTIDVQTANAIQNDEDVLLIDVREQWEYDAGHIPGITHIPMGEVADRLSEIPTDQTVVLTCRSGNRSGQIYNFLRDSGYDNVHNMAGGILAWEKVGYPVEK